MKSLFLFLMLAGAARAQFIVNDPVHTVVSTLIQSNQVAQHAQVLAQWEQQLARLNQQIRQLESQLELQRQMQAVVGDPAVAGAGMSLERLSGTDLQRQYGDTLRAARQTAQVVDSLKTTLDGSVTALGDRTALGVSLERQPSYYQRYAAIDEQVGRYGAVVTELNERSAVLETDLAETLVQLRAAPTQSEVDKLNIKVTALNGQLAEIAARRRDEADKVRVQVLLNDNQAQKERQDLLEKQVADERAALSAAAAWQGTVRIQATDYSGK